MTKSTITREESIQAVFDLKVGYTLGLADIEILKRVARMALVAMDSEPVAIIDQANLDYLRSGADADVWPPEREEMGDVLLYRHPQPAPVVPVVPDFKKLARELVDNLVDCGGLDEGVKEKYLEWAEKTCRAAMLQAGNCRENANSSTNNCREIPETSTNRSREHFISLCNEFWNWSEMDEVCAKDRGYELRMEWDGKVFKHPVTQALWRMYQVAPQEVK